MKSERTYVKQILSSEHIINLPFAHGIHPANPRSELESLWKKLQTVLYKLDANKKN